ncbi:MAG TPA: CAP domain-containing protein [Marmoricola sp.]|nr:CAP domain-containing protein [Marmoricola sp.]
MRENTKRYGTGFGLVTVIATLVVGLILQAGPADAGSAAGSRTTARWSGSIDTRSLSAVNAGYWNQYAAKQFLSTGWLGGSLIGCLPGLSSLTSNAATLTALNYVRSLAGLAPVRLSSTLNAGAQRAALIMSANGALSHSPSSSWKCYSSSGAAAAGRSNLALAYPSIGSGQIIDLYMDEPGSTNHAVGHRRWLLNPFSTVVGTGSTNTANALTVIGPTSSSRPNPKYVPWPTAGYFPNAMEPNGRWSLSAGRRGTSFKRARIHVYQNGVGIAVRKYAVENGYAQPTLVWQMPSSISKTATFRVVVKNIRRKGTTKRFKYAYTVRLFTPTH